MRSPALPSLLDAAAMMRAQEVEPSNVWSFWEWLFSLTLRDTVGGAKLSSIARLCGLCGLWDQVQPL